MYQFELEETEKHLESIKKILGKLDTPKGRETIEITGKKRRGRKPKIQKEDFPVPDLVKKVHKPKKDKRKKRGRPVKSVKIEKPLKETTPPLTPSEVAAKIVQSTKTVVPKKKVKKLPKKRKRIFLKKLSKPIPPKEELIVKPETPPSEVKPEMVE